jgi:hypothetical protein
MHSTFVVVLFMRFEGGRRLPRSPGADDEVKQVRGLSLMRYHCPKKCAQQYYGANPIHSAHFDSYGGDEYEEQVVESRKSFDASRNWTEGPIPANISGGGTTEDFC